jgi:hypothetical protein
MSNSTSDLPPSVAWIEPRSDYQAKYPYNNLTQTESGHLFEMDDTPGAERVRLQHRTGTFTEVQADGTQIHKVIGTNYEIIAQDNNVLIKGTCNITIVGDSIMHVQGDATLQVDGNVYESINGSVNQQVAGDLTSTITGNAIIASKNQVQIQADVLVNGDLSVTGDVTTSGSLNATTNVTAGSQVYAPLVMDGPGQITDSILYLRGLYNTHTHPFIAKAGSDLLVTLPTTSIDAP